MSNLSDLLPAGAGAKSATFTASGTLATGTTVALQSDGTVKAISATGTSYTETLGSDTSIANVDSSQFSAAYHVAGDKIIVGYRNVTDVNGYYVVGTISGSTITFTSPISFSATNTTDVNVTYHEAGQVVVFSYKNGFNDGVARAASLSGTTLTFGSEVAFTTNNTDYTSATYDSDQEKIVVCYSDSTNSDYLTGVALSVSGTAITAGTPVVLESQFATYISVEYHRANTVHVVAYKNQTSVDMRGRGFTVSGTTITNGNQTQIVSGDGRPGSPRGLTYYAEIEKLLLVYQDQTNDYGRIIPLNATTSGGGTVTKGTEEYFTSAAITDAENSLAIEPFTVASKLVITYKNSGDSFLVSVSVDASENITVDTPITLQSGSGGSEQQTLGYDSVAAQMVVAYADKTNSDYATANLYNPAYFATNSADFVGITDEAIANAATGSVVVEGGVITNSTLVPDVPSVSAGSVGLTSDTGQHMGAAYDASADRVVAAYRDNNNSFYGTAAVGTVSGTSISFGTPVVFQSANVNQCKVAYDSTNQLTFIAYNNNSSSRGTARYGSVSGTTIDFSSYNPVQFDTDAVVDLAVVHDPNAGKMVIAYADGGNSYKGTAIVGSLSGTTLSFGTAVVYNSGGASNKNSMAYDANAQKVVISYGDGGNSNYPTSIVGTVSGTSISFGSETVIANVSGSYTATTYDSGNQKIVVSYQDGSDSNAGKAAVGTVSGTSITFGTPVAFAESLAVGGWLSSAYDSTNGVVVFNFKNFSGNAGTCLPAVVDGTSFSYGSSVVFESGSTEYTNTVYDTTAQKFVVVYNDGGGGDLGSAVVLSPSVTTGLTTGSTYYVQSDGSLSTTSSSVTAGKALSSTTLLLKG
jgi:hypothetical protein